MPDLTEWLARQETDDTRAMAPTAPEATAAHWPKPKDRCERCGVHGHSVTICPYEGEL